MRTQQINLVSIMQKTFTIDTSSIIYGIVIAIILCCVVAATIGTIHELQTPVPASATPITPTVTPIPTPSYPSVLTYTVLSMTTSSGHYQILTTAGNIIYCQNYYDYNLHDLQNAYTANIIGTDGSAYIISSPVLIAQHYRYYEPRDYYNSVRFYHYGNHYYQESRGKVDEVSWKVVRGEPVIEGYPQNDIYRR